MSRVILVMWFLTFISVRVTREKVPIRVKRSSQNFACTFSEKAKSSFTISQSSFFCYLSNLLPSPLVPSLCDIKLVKSSKKPENPQKITVAIPTVFCQSFLQQPRLHSPLPVLCLSCEETQTRLQSQVENSLQLLKCDTSFSRSDLSTF